MKILQVIQYLSARKGGSVSNVSNLVRYLQLRDHKVTIYATEDDFDPAFARSLHPARIVTFPSWGGFLRFSPGMGKTLDKEIEQFDVVHLNNHWSYQNAVVAKYAKKHKVPYVLSPHGSLPIMMRGHGRKALFNLIWGNRILMDASGIIAVCQMEANQVLNKGIAREKIKIIPNAIDSKLDIPSRKGAFKKKYHIGPNEKIFLFLARVHPIKGVDLLIRAFAKLAGDRKDIKLVIAGPDDGYLETAKRMVAGLQIADKVIFTGPLYNAEKYEAYVDANVFVLPSSYEIFSIAILEAWSCGVPVIITDRQGLADHVRGQAGEVVPYNWEKLYLAMKDLINNERLCVEFGEKGKKLVREYFTWNKVIGLYEQLYREVLAKSKK